MQFIWDIYSTPSWVTALVLMTLVFLFVIFVILKVVHRKAAFLSMAFAVVLCYISFFLYLPAAFIISVGLFIVILTITLMINLGDLRKFISNPFKITQVKNTGFKVEKIFDKQAMYKQIERAVLDLSKSKTGAIMTFEKNTSLKDIITNGVEVKAPVSAELLETIFYPGTRLHDGAVVIHNDQIVAASVFYTPTTKAFAGKYGSRHRAGIGISEISDAITVIVSEETGRISFAVNGQLETVDQSNFLRVFENYMSSSND